MFAGCEVITSIPDTLPPCNESENSTTFQPIATLYVAEVTSVECVPCSTAMNKHYTEL